MSLSDAEVLATFMEARCPPGFDPGTVSFGGWWYTNGQRKLEPWDIDSLDRLHIIEERLTDDQWRSYEVWFYGVIHYGGVFMSLPRMFLHATAEQKITALAAVLRPLVEGKA